MQILAPQTTTVSSYPIALWHDAPDQNNLADRYSATAWGFLIAPFLIQHSGTRIRGVRSSAVGLAVAHSLPARWNDTVPDNLIIKSEQSLAEPLQHGTLFGRPPVKRRTPFYQMRGTGAVNHHHASSPSQLSNAELKSPTCNNTPRFHTPAASVL
ncbi:hypothetical protein P153DRAFT_384187 [Dothidotthia symphoricarpi CBS 119687]|uniref:Uncharacterized protein n=1 Tax=Dothidotthia symphoricarpi CBS 119687 TaxID=1392245 RepID=A0A6A6AIB0_9PLEO|nr:uncharacterized protein P153DRAFT_384187 [Dothidotthia symphoricarpi CBS 119687]KAF2130973.1 hypothetical protein P153DRAFT_384187 [Dothidotthia symphoricarpi CBS 119687]